MAASYKIRGESSDICQATLKSMKLPEILRLRHLLDCLDIRLAGLNSFVMSDEEQELSRSYTKHTLEWIHLQLKSP